MGRPSIHGYEVDADVSVACVGAGRRVRAREKPSQDFKPQALDVMFVAVHPPGPHRAPIVPLPQQLACGDHRHSTKINAVSSAHTTTNELMILNVSVGLTSAPEQ